MDVQALHRYLIAFLLPFFVRTTNSIEILCSLLVIASATYTAVKSYNRPFDRSLALLFATSATALFFSAHIASYLVIGTWKQLLVLYIFALAIFFDVSDRMVSNFLDLPTLPTPSLSMLAEILTVLRTCDAARSVQYLFPVVRGLAAPFALWPALKASCKDPARLLLCATATFYMATLQVQRLVAILAHHALCAHTASEEERRRIASEYQEQVSAAIDLVHRVETEEQDLAAGYKHPYYDELCSYIKEWQKAVGIPELLVVDAEASPDDCVPREPETKPNGTRGISRSTRPVYDEGKLMPTVARAVSQGKRQRNRTEVFRAQIMKSMMVVRARSASPAPRDRRLMMAEEDSAC
jgi:hypothetical protein